jgi:hypothetical protein
MTAAEYVAQSKPKRSKYGNKPVAVDGYRIDSGREARRWRELQLMEINGKIHDLVRQPKYILAPGVMIAGEGRKRPAMRYRADFAYVEVATGHRIVEDVKSAPTAAKADFRMRQHLMKSVHGIDVRIVK